MADDSERYYRSGNFVLDGKINEWLAWDKNQITCAAIRRLVMARKFQELSACLMTRIKFGSAGLRGRMVPGYSGMNELVVVQTAQGLLKYLEELDQMHLKQGGIVVGYDVRYNSKRFAELVSSVFVHKNYTVRLFGVYVPSSYISFAVSKYKCIMGIMITGCQNVKEDNGFKIYGSDACLILQSVESVIEMHILQNLEPLTSSWDTTILLKSDKVVNPLVDVTRAYMDMISKQLVDEHKIINGKSNLKFVYTPLHGVGSIYFTRIMERSSLTMVPVCSQQEPNPAFPTVKYPNPEEGKTVLNLAIDTAEEFKCTIILANDCDAGRLGVAERNPKTGEWFIFNGNEIGALLGWWAVHCYQAHNPNEYLYNIYVITSMVTSKILKTMGKFDGFHCAETHSGFRWIGHKAHQLMQLNKKVIFGYQESFGFMWGTDIFDKDGLLAGVHMATMAAYLNHHGVSLAEHLSGIYGEYGHHVNIESYYFCPHPSVSAAIFERLRNYHGIHSYPKSILDNTFPIKHIRDLAAGYDNSQPGNKATLPKLINGNTLSFEFYNGVVAILTTSATESKIKYFAEICSKPKQGSKAGLEKVLHLMLEAVIEEFLQPTKNELILKPT